MNTAGGIPSGPVHFVYLGGPWRWQSSRAVHTARVHGAPIWLWSPTTARAGDWIFATETPDGMFGAPDEFRDLDLPDWLRDHPIKLANVKDLYVWRILHEHGGLYLDLDTISLAPVWDLLGAHLLVSSEWEPGFEAGPRYNSAVAAAIRGSVYTDGLAEDAERLLLVGETRWGGCGPWLLTEKVPEYNADWRALHPQTGVWKEAVAAAPMPLLNGWRDDTIDRYYDGDPIPEGTRVIHCYQSSRPERFLADRWMPGDAR